MKYLILIMLFVCSFGAFGLDVYSNSAQITIVFNCVNNGVCSPGTTANISILNSSNGVYILNEPMIYNNSLLTYNLSSNATIGIYSAIVTACDGSSCSSQMYMFRIDTTTEELSLNQKTDNYGLLWLLLVISVLLIILGLGNNMQIMGILGSLGIASLGLIVSYLSHILGYFTIGAGIVLIVYFAFIHK